MFVLQLKSPVAFDRSLASRICSLVHRLPSFVFEHGPSKEGDMEIMLCLQLEGQVDLNFVELQGRSVQAAELNGCVTSAFIEC